MNATPVRPSLLFPLGFLLAACPPKLPPQMPPPQVSVGPVLRIPAGCQGDLSGTYQHAQAAHFRYLAQDDGGTLLLTVRTDLPDGGQTPLDAQVVLQRTAGGFTGMTLATAFNASGTQCEARFPTEVVACPDGGLLLRADSTTSLDSSCRTPMRSLPATRVEHLLLRELVDAGPDPET